MDVALSSILGYFVFIPYNELKARWDVDKSMLEESKNVAENKYNEINEQYGFRGSKSDMQIWVMETPEGGVKNLGDSSPLMQSKGYKEVKSIGASIDQSIDVAGICNEAATLDQEDMVIDESNSGEPWVQGLMEGEYSDLSVEEPLSAVVALIGVANEGNSIRIILEECLEAANALKKQMWAEVQLDKCRMKEEYVMKIQYRSCISDKTEPNVQISSVEGRQSPLPTVDDKNNLVSTNPVEQKEHLHDAQNDPNYPIHMPSKRNPQIQEVSTCTDNLSLLQPGYAAERSWSQLKSYIGHKAEEMYLAARLGSPESLQQLNPVANPTTLFAVFVRKDNTRQPTEQKVIRNIGLI
ncbi:hypothetical protein HYC85_031611 [Camellia sinensis]|uniref:WHIM1 domain-containing protein n=1 Tax=Camellia sinensis TaxID=4442 RepID=A0A7J7FSQ9_CAMSI|nr:hypothetical protein HYC85_031611 [Camellia sinensis]